MPKEPCIRWGSRSPMGRGNFEGGKGRPIVKYRDTLQSIMRKQLNRSRCRLGYRLGWAQRNVSDAGPALLRYVAMAINFGTHFAITGFVGYNFSCMIVSDMVLDSRGGFSGSCYPMETAEFEVLRDVAIATILSFYIWSAHWRHVANTTEPSICDSDAALRQITLTTCYYYCAFSTLTLLVEHQEEHLARNKLSDAVLAWLAVWSKGGNVLHMVQLMPLPPIISCFIKI